MSFIPSPQQLNNVFDLLLKEYGPQGWWPGETPFEVMIGAILTQNTSWSNVEKAITNLKHADLLSANAITNTNRKHLAELIKSSGYFNIKAERLMNFCLFLQQNGGESGLRKKNTKELRLALLAVKGIGPETADDILLYAFERPVFVIDAYTIRIFSRLGMACSNELYEDMRSGFETALGPNEELYNEYHALIVRHAKQTCSKTRPHCEQCGLVEMCSMGSNRQNPPGS